MVFGYDEPRPTREDYDSFVHKLADGLQELGCGGLSLMLYGSYVRSDHLPGRSDIDALMIFPGDVIIDKPLLRRAGGVLDCVLAEHHVPFQVTVSDLRTMIDGRFNSYAPDFKTYFDSEGRMIFGSDSRELFKYENPTMPDQAPFTFNLRKSRQGLFLADYLARRNYGLFLEKFGKSLDAASRASKQVLHMVDGTLRSPRFSALRELKSIFPQVDVAPLEEIRHLYTHLDELDALYCDKGNVLAVWERSISFFEALTQAYLNLNPRPSP